MYVFEFFTSLKMGVMNVFIDDDFGCLFITSDVC